MLVAIRPRCTPKSLSVIAVVAALVALAGCASRVPAPVVDRMPTIPPAAPVAAPPIPEPSLQPSATPAPVPATPEKDWRPEFYTVKRGDTLYQVALEHGLDYRELAAMNNIENINLIRVGQVLRLRPPGESAMAGPATGASPSTSPATAGSESRPSPDSRAATDPRAASEPRAAGPLPRGNSETYKSGPKAVKLPFSEAAFAQLVAGSKGEGPSGGAGASPAGPSVSGPSTSGPAAPPVAAGGGATAASAPSASAAPGGVPPVAMVTPSPSPVPPAPPPPSAPSAPPIIAAPPVTSVDSADDRIDWGWPVRGRIINGYSETASLKGIDIGGSAGAPILSTAPGKVVYAGSGLRGYGKLVIVKHNKTYLSAYAHLDQISVKEGQMVTKGQELGKMGSTDADQVKLHFEIRSLGKPVDPMRYLPKS